MLKTKAVIEKSFYRDILTEVYKAKFEKWYEENSTQLSYRWLEENNLHPDSLLENKYQTKFATWVTVEYARTDLSILGV